MIDDVEDGEINMVITKDLSRLGKNYILAGQFTEVYFLSKGVRYIALNDGVDTAGSENDIAPFVISPIPVFSIIIYCLIFWFNSIIVFSTSFISLFSFSLLLDNTSIVSLSPFSASASGATFLSNSCSD